MKLMKSEAKTTRAARHARQIMKSNSVRMEEAKKDEDVLDNGRCNGREHTIHQGSKYCGYKMIPHII